VIDAILNSSFFTSIITFMLSAASLIVSIILLPFSILLQGAMPDLDNALMQITAFFDLVATYIGWAFNATGVPSVVVVLVVGYFTFTVTMTLATWGIKLLLGWKKALIT